MLIRTIYNKKMCLMGRLMESVDLKNHSIIVVECTDDQFYLERSAKRGSKGQMGYCEFCGS
jgi:broad specificity phosphatase PhoE